MANCGRRKSWDNSNDDIDAATDDGYHRPHRDSRFTTRPPSKILDFPMKLTV